MSEQGTQNMCGHARIALCAFQINLCHHKPSHFTHVIHDSLHETTSYAQTIEESIGHIVAASNHLQTAYSSFTDHPIHTG